jgi:hypothetical protein
VVLEEKRQQPLFCLPEKLVLTIEQAEDIVMRLIAGEQRSAE